MSLLGSPLRLPSGAVLANRLAKAAMSEALADPATGAPTDALVRVYERWGRSGAGLLVTGHVIVDASGRAEVGNTRAEEHNRAALRRWATAAQGRGAALWMQINHAGRQAPRRMTREPLAPSAVPMKGFAGLFAAPRALSEPEIAGLIARFADAAALAKDTGFAGVQLHAAHGYLVSQFLSPRTNRRDDAWGGDPARRSRFLLETVRAMRAGVGPAFPIGVKLNSADFQRGGFSIDEAMDVARALEAAGIDLLEVSGGNYESPAMAGASDRTSATLRVAARLGRAEAFDRTSATLRVAARLGRAEAFDRASSREREAYFLDYARRIRGVAALPIMLTGGMRSRAVMEDALASRAIDVVGLARPMTYAPDLPRQLLAGTADGAPVVRIRSRIRAADDALQVLWFQTQIHRMGQGLDPDLTLGKLAALWHGVRLMNPFGAAA